MIPEDWINEASKNPIEFTATVNIGRCPDGTMAVLVHVMGDNGEPMKGWQFIADLETNYKQDAATCKDAVKVSD